MNDNKGKMQTSLRIIGAIAAKDIMDALKNRTIISVMIGVVFLMLSTQALPWLLRLNSMPLAVAVDPGQSGLVAESAIPGGSLLEVDSHFRYCILATQHPNLRINASDIFPLLHIWRDYFRHPCI